VILARARTYLALGRVSNLPTVWTNVLAAAALAGAVVSARVTVALMIACSFLYVAGMFLNDAFDREIDARERPERPIPSGAIAASEVFAAGLVLLAIGVALVGAAAALAGRGLLDPLVSAVSLAALIVLYDVWHKSNPLSPVVMAGCRVLVFVTTAVVVADALTMPLVIGACAQFAYLMGLTWHAKRETRGFVVARLVAGISLVDAVLVACTGRPLLAGVAVLGFAATLGLQRWVRGT
jgi:4-hydroxybenzoate polyprenyltransferase